MVDHRLFCFIMTTVACISNQSTKEKCRDCYLKQHDNGFFDCSECKLPRIPEFPSNATKIDLSYNCIKFVSNVSFSRLLNLRILNMSKNDISIIEHLAFGNNVEIDELDLSDNKLTHTQLSNSGLHTLTRLRRLYLDHNEFSDYPSGLRYLTELIELKVDVFRDFHFGNNFMFLRKLANITFNPVGYFRLRNNTFYGLQNSPIENLNLDFWESIQNPLENNLLIHFHHLKVLRIKFGMTCSIVNVLETFYGLRGRTLDELTFERNMRKFPLLQDGLITEHNMRHLLTMCVRVLRFYRDQIYFFPIDRMMTSTLGKCIRELYFFRNELFMTFSGLLSFFSLPAIETLSLPISFTPPQGYFSPGLTTYDTPEITAYDNLKNNFFDKYCFNFNITMTIPPTLKHIDFSYNVISETGLKTVRNYSRFDVTARWHFNSSNIQTIELANTQIELCNFDFDIHCPHVILLNASGWICKNLNPSFLNKCGKLRYFNASHSQLGSGFKNDKTCRFLVNKRHLEELDMSRNNIDKLCDSLFNDSSNSLKKLYLDLNLFLHLPAALQVLKNIEYVSFRHNALQYFDEQDIFIMSGKNSTLFDFYGNKFDCSCQGIDGLIWISEHVENLVSVHKLKCIDGRNVSDVINHIRQFRLRCLSFFWLQMSIVSLLFVMITILLTAAGYRHKRFIRYLYLAARNFIRGRKPVDKNKYKFDIFISYSQEDCEWVVNYLTQKLSTEFELRVCFHENDFTPGMKISDNIFNCINNSRLHLFVITQAFLESKWGKFELEITQEHVLQYREDENIIVLFKEEIKKEDMPKSLQDVWYRVTCLKWPADPNDVKQVKLFWARLADATVLQ